MTLALPNLHCYRLRFLHASFLSLFFYFLFLRFSCPSHLSPALAFGCLLVAFLLFPFFQYQSEIEWEEREEVLLAPLSGPSVPRCSLGVLRCLHHYHYHCRSLGRKQNEGRRSGGIEPVPLVATSTQSVSHQLCHYLYCFCPAEVSATPFPSSWLPRCVAHTVACTRSCYHSLHLADGRGLLSAQSELSVAALHLHPASCLSPTSKLVSVHDLRHRVAQLSSLLLFFEPTLPLLSHHLLLPLYSTHCQFEPHSSFRFSLKSSPSTHFSFVHFLIDRECVLLSTSHQG
mmetsp:Transcript_11448/g.30324  ORF Transcript_11448/g.30324 Transcript_11448/m.30324 type:complete len:287 (+) Transcript_11448:2540-3400(+)